MHVIEVVVAGYMRQGIGFCYACETKNKAVGVLMAYVARKHQPMLIKHLRGRVQSLSRMEVHIPCCENHIPTLNALGIRLRNQNYLFSIGPKSKR